MQLVGIKVSLNHDQFVVYDVRTLLRRLLCLQGDGQQQRNSSKNSSFHNLSFLDYPNNWCKGEKKWEY